MPLRSLGRISPARVSSVPTLIVATLATFTAFFALHGHALAAGPTPTGCPTPPPRTSVAVDSQLSLVPPTNILILPAGGTQQLPVNAKDAAYEILNTSVASVSAGAGNAQVLVIKGEHQGDTILRITKPGTPVTPATATAAAIPATAAECVDVRIIVKPPNNRFVLSVGLGTSSVPKRTISVIPSSPSINPVGTPAAGSTTVNRAVVTEESKSQALSFSALGHVRITDNTFNNFYATLGSVGEGGIVYGVSYGNNDALFITVGLHSANVTDFAPGYFNNAVVPTGVSQVTLTRRQAGVIFSLSIPIGILGSSGFLGAK